MRNSGLGLNSMVRELCDTPYLAKQKARFQIARVGAGVSSYVALLSDITLPVIPMVIFATFSLIAAALVTLLPETKDQPLPETLRDAVLFDEKTSGGGGGGKYSLYGIDDGRSSVVLMTKGASGVESAESKTTIIAVSSEAAAAGDDGASAVAGVGMFARRSETASELPVINEVPEHVEFYNTSDTSRSTTPTHFGGSSDGGIRHRLGGDGSRSGRDEDEESWPGVMKAVS